MNSAKGEEVKKKKTHDQKRGKEKKYKRKE
jgi:hypothetical protein